jgi:hypothetical protein
MLQCLSNSIYLVIVTAFWIVWTSEFTYPDDDISMFCFLITFSKTKSLLLHLSTICLRESTTWRFANSHCNAPRHNPSTDMNTRILFNINSFWFLRTPQSTFHKMWVISFCIGRAFISFSRRFLLHRVSQSEHNCCISLVITQALWPRVYL